MSLILYNKDLLSLMENFYVLTGIRMVLFDENYTEIVSYPPGTTSFCAYMRENPDFNRLCCESDKAAFKKCRKTQELIVYKCHAGLIEATAPLTNDGVVIGYIMFGQITDTKSKKDLIAHMRQICSKYSSDDTALEKAKKIKYKNDRQILAASKILEACTSYILLKKMIRPSKKQLLSKIEAYIDTHLSEKISVEVLCKEFNISRTGLYELVGKEVGGGIASFIRHKRLIVAKDFLLSTNMPVTDVAYKVGFNDYNYFLRVFKSEFGISPKKLFKESAAERVRIQGKRG